MNPARGYILSIELTEWTDRNRDGRVTTAFDELPVLRRHRRLILVILDNHRVRTPGVGDAGDGRRAGRPRMVDPGVADLPGETLRARLGHYLCVHLCQSLLS